MGLYHRIYSSLLNGIQRLSIYHRILIGNSVIIFIGAVGGTLFTHALAGTANDIWLILFFSAMGILMSIVINAIIIKHALKPFYQLKNIVARMDRAQPQKTIPNSTAMDPDISKLSTAIYSLLNNLDRRTQQLSALSERFIHIQEEERLRIALELHDETGQALSLLSIMLERMQQQVPEQCSDLKQPLAEAQTLAGETLHGLRNIFHGIRPTMLDDLGLVPAIRWYGRDCLEPKGIEFSINSPDPSEDISPQIKITLYRIVQEAINNIERHSNAKKVSIHLQQLDNCINLEIEDDGSGFDLLKVTDTAVAEKKLGLIGIRERAELIGGEAEISSLPGKGTKINVRVPVEI